MSKIERPHLTVISPDAQRREQTLRRRLPKPIVSVHKRSKSRLHELLNDCFAASDDHFFDLAKTSQKQADQDDFFCAMRELRCKKSKIVETFFSGFEQAFLQLADVSDSAANSDNFAKINIDQLAIVGHDDLDRLVAKEAMVNSSLSRFKHSLELLARRFDAVVPIDVQIEQLPVSPARLCDLFIHACKTLDIHSRAYLVLFKVFERTFLQPLDSLYAAMNSHLEERGVLPNKTGPAAAPVKTRSDSSHNGGLEQPVDAEFLHLDANNMVPPAPGSSFGPGHANGHGQVSGGAAANAYGGAYSAATPVSAAGNSATGSALKGAMAGGTGAHNKRDLAAHIVTQLTRDQNIAAPFLPLFAQLQAPIEAIAAEDDSFFDDHNHAARQLFNSLANCATFYDKSSGDSIEHDPLFAKIEFIINKLQGNYDSDGQLYQTLTKELEQFVRQEQRRANLYEKRMLDAETGKHKAQKARQQVLQTIAEVTHGLDMDSNVRQLIDKAWYQVLFVSLLKHGVQSSQWDDACQTLIDIATSTQPHFNAAEKAHNLAALPELCQRVRAGLEALFFDAFKIDAMVEQLGETINNLAQQPTAQAKAPPAVEPAQVAVEPAIAEPDKPDNAFMAQAKNLGRGSWCDLTLNPGKETRCRLAAVIGDYEKYIFVRRDGTKFAEKTLVEVARALAAQELVMLDSNKLFDQALELVISARKGK